MILDWMPRKQFPLSFMPIFPLRGRYREVPDDATAFGSSRRSRWALSMVGQGFDEETFAADRAWAKGFYEAVRPFAPSAAAYLNFEADASEDRMRASYGEEKYRRLAALKAVWDPDNVFRHNANIVPEGAAAAPGVPQPRAAADEAPASERRQLDAAAATSDASRTRSDALDRTLERVS